MGAFISRTLSLFVALVMVLLLAYAFLWYTTPKWMRDMTRDAMQQMERTYSPGK